MESIITTSVAFAALVVSSIALWRDKFYFRGTEITLANRDDMQGATALKYDEHPDTVRSHFPPYDDAMKCAIVTLVWLNTGDRAGYVHIKSLDIVGSIQGLHVAKWSYKDVPAGSAVLHHVLVWGQSADMVGQIQVAVTYEWPRIRPTSTRRVTASGRVSVMLKAATGIRRPPLG